MNETDTTPYTRIAQSPRFRALLESKKRFLIPACLFFLAFYFLLPILTSYATFLNTPVVGAITWAWVFAFAQFLMTWIMCGVYTKRAAEFDRMAQEVSQDESGGTQE